MSPSQQRLIVLLVALSAFGPMSMSIYTPSMPDIGRAFAATDEQVKLTLTTFLLGFSAGQMIYGPLSDRFGRRPVLIAGVLVYAAMGLACAFATSIDMLIGLRLFHGIGVCSGAVVARAITRDIFGHEGAARVIAWIALGINVAPAVAPIIGGHLTGWFGWQSIFLFLAAFGFVVLVAVLVELKESNPYLGQNAGILNTLRQCGPMLANRRYMGFVIAIGATFGAMFAYVVASPFVLMKMIGLAPETYGYWILTSVAGFTCGSFIATRVVGRLSPDRAILIGLIVATLGCALMLVLALLGRLHVLTIVGPYFVVATGCGMTMAHAYAGGVNQFPRQAGTASSLMGTLQMSGAALATALVTAFTDGTQMPMIWVMLGCAVIGLVATLTLLNPWHRHNLINPG